MKDPKETSKMLELCIEHALMHTGKDFLNIYEEVFLESLSKELHKVVNENKDIFSKFLNLTKYKNFQSYLEESFLPLDAEDFTHSCKSPEFWDYEFEELHSVLEDNTKLFSDILEIIKEECS